MHAVKTHRQTEEAVRVKKIITVVLMGFESHTPNGRTGRIEPSTRKLSSRSFARAVIRFSVKYPLGLILFLASSSTSKGKEVLQTVEAGAV